MIKSYIDFCNYYIFNDSTLRMVHKNQTVEGQNIPVNPPPSFDYSKFENWSQKIQKEVSEGKAVIVKLNDCPEFYDSYWNSVLEKQKQLIYESNWTQLRDVNLPNNSEWIQYRKDLFDILEKYKNNPCGVVWPVKPS